FIDEYLYSKREHGDNFTKHVRDRADYLSIIYDKQKPFFKGMREKVLRGALAHKCFTSARKNMSLLRLSKGLESWAYSLKFKPTMLFRLPGLFLRYLRFRFKNNALGGLN
ncbi:MAG: hypothetical protein ACYDFU_00655, partial [Nitrospirota bacterium]